LEASLIAAAVPSGTASSGSHVWTVTSPTTRKARMRVRWTSDLSVMDASNANFTIR